MACIPAPQESELSRSCSLDKTPPRPAVLLKFTCPYPKAFEFETSAITPSGVFPVGYNISFLVLV